MVELNPGLVAAIGAAVFVLFVLVCSFVSMVVMAHRKRLKDQQQLMTDSQALHDIGANKLANLLVKVATLDIRGSVAELKSYLQQIRTPKDALNAFSDSWYFQLGLRLADAGEKQKILDAVVAKLQSAAPATLLLAQQTASSVPVVQQQTTTTVKANP